MLQTESIMPLEAVLVLDSRSTTTNVRHQAWTNTWSRLYQIGSYYLDLTLKSRGTSSLLLGQLIGPNGFQARMARVQLTADDGRDLGSARISPNGELYLRPQHKGSFRLLLELDAERLMVSTLELN